MYNFCRSGFGIREEKGHKNQDSTLKRKTGKEIIRVTTAIKLYENDKLDEEDVLETLHQSEVHN